jgi:hypothetical protein
VSGVPRSRATLLALLLVGLASPLLFAAATDQVWEDAFIALRHGVHLCRGEGLSFRPGARIQGFSSPLGVLALAGSFGLARSTDGAIALYRVASAGAFAIGLVLLVRALGAAGARPLQTLLAAALYLLESKSVAFSSNGMETAFVLLALTLGLGAMARPAGERPSWLGAAWGLLLWTRADGAVYALLMALALLVFPGRPRVQAVRPVAFAGLIAAVLYAPWLAFSWLYYGSLLPLSAVAKVPSQSWVDWLLRLGQLPSIWARLYLPPYAEQGGWDPARPLSLVLAAVASLGWLAPGNTLRRRCSLVVLGGCSYLSAMPRTYPWYFPAVVLLSLPALALWLPPWRAVVNATAPLIRRVASAATLALAVGMVAASGWLLVDYGRLARALRQVVELGERRTIGLWLRAGAGPDEAIYLECPGYIGYYSDRLVLDYPGLVAPEVLAARRSGPDDFAGVGMTLRPEWLVLRPVEVHWFETRAPGWLASHYTPRAVFDVRAQLRPLLPRHRAALYDAAFVVLRRRS